MSAVTLRASVPLGGRAAAAEIRLDGQAEPLARERLPTVTYSVDPAYFSTLGIPIVRGRSFSQHDRDDAVPVAIVNEWTARSWWHLTSLLC